MKTTRNAWSAKFRFAASGLVVTVKTQRSFWVHVPVAVLVVAVAAWLRVEPWRWAVLVLTITAVISLELLNTSIEQLVSVVHPQRHPQIGAALDAAASAVLVASIGAVIVGLITLGPPLLQWLGG